MQPDQAFVGCACVPHFYFHLQGGEGRVPDPNGVSLPDEEAAWYQAYRRAREIAAAPGGENRRGWHSVEVEDERGAAIWTLPLAELVELAR